MRSILKSIIAAGLCLGIVFSTGVGAYAAFPKTQSEMTSSSSSNYTISSGQTDLDHPYIYKESEYSTWKYFPMERDGK